MAAPLRTEGSPQRRVLQHSAWLFGGQSLSAVLALLQGVMLARALGVERYGAWALVTTYVLSVVQLFDCRVWETLIKYVPEYRTSRNAGKAAGTIRLCFAVEIVTGVLSFGVIWLTAEVAARWLLQDVSAASAMVLFGSFALLNIPYESASALLRLADRFDRLALYRVLVAGFRVMATAMVWATGVTLPRMLGAHLLGTAAAVPVLLLYAYRAGQSLDISLRSSSGATLSRQEYREQGKLLLYSSLIGTSRIVSSKADNLVLGLFANVAVVGAYDLARTIMLQLGSFSNALYAAMYPEISRLVARREFSRMLTLLKRVSLAVLAGVVPCCLIATLVASWLFPVVFGEAFRAAVLPFRILVWQFLWLPLIWFPGYLLIMNRAGLLLRLACVDAGVFLVFLFTLVPIFGAVGTAGAVTGRYLLWSLMAVGIFTRVRPEPLVGQRRVELNATTN